MKLHNRIKTVVFLIFVLVLNSTAQEIKVSEKLSIIKLSESAYIHTSKGNNGLIIKDKGEVILVSTPMSDDLTRELIKWIRTDKKLKIKGYIIDMWHPDAMEGLDVVHEFHIPSYANNLTIEIVKKKKYPVPQNGFSDSLILKVGNKKVICKYFGPGHTSDGIVVWIPDERILFGSNSVRALHSWYGNIADANLDNWSETIKKVKACYGNAKIVVPGHGEYGGSELLDETIKLYSPDNWGKILKSHNIPPMPVFQKYKRVFVTAEKDSVTDNEKYLFNSIVFVDKEEKYIQIESPQIIYNEADGKIRSEYGRMRIYKKNTTPISPIVDGYYKRLYLNLRDDQVKLELIVKELLR